MVSSVSFTSYLIALAFPCRKVIAHHEARIFLGTAVNRCHTCPNKILEKRCDANLHVGYRRSAYQGGFNPTSTLIYSPHIVVVLLPSYSPAQLRCA